MNLRTMSRTDLCKNKEKYEEKTFILKLLQKNTDILKDKNQLMQKFLGWKFKKK